MKRNIIKVHEDKCNGCGLCITACHEGALQLINGKAVLVSDVYCDGLGACLPACPTGALEIIERDAEEFDELEVEKLISQKQAVQDRVKFKGCPSTQARTFKRNIENVISPENVPRKAQSELRQWPCQIKLIPSNAPYLNNAKLLIAADCTAFAYRDIHSFMKNKITIIGCPKLDNTDYSEKLTEIISINNIESITIMRMEVPCCSGLVTAVKTAMENSNKIIPWNILTISTDGEILE